MVAKMMAGATPSPIRSIIRMAGGVSAMAIIGQFTLVAAIPLLARLYSPADFGIFTIYLSIVNILGAIAALRFESSIYVVEDRARGQVAFKLILLAVFATTVTTLATGYLLLRVAPGRLNHLVWLVPIGMAGAAVAEAMNCWSLRFGYVRDFAIGRVIQPATMALLQLIFGVAHLGGEAMVYAHILSQAVLILVIGTRILSLDDAYGIVRAPWLTVIATARREYKFPMFDLPAALAAFTIINLPAILIGSLFGANFAGFFGVAARIVTAPIALIANPLGNVFVAIANEGRNDRSLLGSAHGLLILAAGVIALPILGLGLAAPYLVVPFLGEPWMVAGQIVSALACMGAAQAIATPLQMVPTILRRQEVRLLLDVARALLMFGPLAVGVHAGWQPLHVIYLMAAGGAVGFALSAATSLVLLTRDAQSAGACATTNPLQRPRAE
ncbi:oligosaccharide flippase family protein [Mesorhizobium sp. 43Arga]